MSDEKDSNVKPVDGETPSEIAQEQRELRELRMRLQVQSQHHASEIKSLSEKYEALLDELQNQHAFEIARLKEGFNTRSAADKAEIESLRLELASLIKREEELLEALDSTRRELSVSIDERHRLSAEISQLDQRLASTEAERNRLSEELAAIRMSVERERLRASELQDLLHAEQQSHSFTKKHAQDLEAAFERERQEHAETRARHDELARSSMRRHEVMSAEIQTLFERLGIAERELESCQKTIDELSADLATTRKARDEAAIAAVKLQRMLQELQNERSEIENRAALEKRTLEEELRQRETSFRKREAELFTELQQQRLRAQETERELETVRVALRAREEQVHAMDRDAQAIREELLWLRRSRMEIMTRLDAANQKIKSYEKEIQQLKQQIEETVRASGRDVRRASPPLKKVRYTW